MPGLPCAAAALEWASQGRECATGGRERQQGAAGAPAVGHRPQQEAAALLQQPMLQQRAQQHALQLRFEALPRHGAGGGQRAQQRQRRLAAANRSARRGEVKRDGGQQLGGSGAGWGGGQAAAEDGRCMRSQHVQHSRRRRVAALVASDGGRSQDVLFGFNWLTRYHQRPRRHAGGSSARHWVPSARWLKGRFP